MMFSRIVGKGLSSVKVVFFVFGEGSSRPKMIWYHLSCKGKKVFEEQKQLCDRIMCRYFTEEARTILKRVP